MLYLLIGLITGIIFNFLPLWQPSGAVEVYPEWFGSIESIDSIEKSIRPELSGIILKPVQTDNSVFIVSGAGALLKKTGFSGFLSVSGNGSSIVQYEKVGTTIELSNMDGDRFWKMKSGEYPYLSYNGKIIFLLNGDQSRIRIIDNNGNSAGAGEISGRVCTTISFANRSDNSGIGFLDGSYYILNSKGVIIHHDTVPESSMIKGIGVSNNGGFIIHYGNSNKDWVRIAQPDAEYHTIPLNNSHLTKTALCAADNGCAAIIDFDRVMLIDDDGSVESIIPIQPKMPGTASIEYTDGIYTVSYMDESSMAHFILLYGSRNIFTKTFPGELFLETSVRPGAILLRGSQGLYCYSYYSPGN